MIRKIKPGTVGGSIRIPTSKSHTIRALLIATLAEGTSVITAPLESADTRACVAACRMLGARIREESNLLTVEGVGGRRSAPDDVIDVGNSGTTLYLALGTAALGEGYTVFTGDDQIRRRTAQPLLSSLGDLGAKAESTRGNGCAPIVAGGGITGGRTAIECPTSQYLSSLLLCSPLGLRDTEIDVVSLNERPYVEITLDWLDRQGIAYERRGWDYFGITGGQTFQPFERTIPGDFSSATFFLCAAAIAGGTLEVIGLDMNDSQGDKAIVSILREMGCQIDTKPESISLRRSDLRGGEFDLNATPDALPALAVTACFADGETRLLNVPQAREKETDRIAVVRQELERIGADVEELPDGLVVRGDPNRAFRSGRVNGHYDHRIVMALAIAALRADGPLEIESAEAADITFPTFFDLLEEVRAS